MVNSDYSENSDKSNIQYINKLSREILFLCIFYNIFRNIMSFTTNISWLFSKLSPLLPKTAFNAALIFEILYYYPNLFTKSFELITFYITNTIYEPKIIKLTNSKNPFLSSLYQ